MRRLLIPSLLTLTLAGCGGGSSAPATADTSPSAAQLLKSPVPRNATPIVTVADYTAAANGNNAFGLHALAQLADGGNVVFSPYSATQAMALAAAGAKGDTLTEIEQAMSFVQPQSNFLSALNALDLRLTADTTGDGAPQFNLANAIWTQQGYPVQAAYLDTLAANLGAGVHQADFAKSPDNARLAINDWAAQQTSQRITDLLASGSVTPNTRLVLANAIWFKGDWLQPFDAGRNLTLPFHAASGDVDVPFMRMTSQIRYSRAGSYQAIELPYTGDKLSMLLVLPDSGAANLPDVATLNQLTGGLSARSMMLALPKFKFTSALDLGPALGKLGIHSAFDPARADFSGIDGSRSLSITHVVQKAYIALDEKGTEAAAATGISVGITAIGSGDLPLSFDRPFLFALRERQSGLLLFVGLVTKPTQG